MRGFSTFFKIWFAFCALLAIGTLAVQAYAVITIATHPEIVGQAAGKIQRGYEQEVSKPAPQSTDDATAAVVGVVAQM